MEVVDEQGDLFATYPWSRHRVNVAALAQAPKNEMYNDPRHFRFDEATAATILDDIKWLMDEWGLIGYAVNFGEIGKLHGEYPAIWSIHYTHDGCWFIDCAISRQLEAIWPFRSQIPGKCLQTPCYAQDHTRIARETGFPVETRHWDTLAVNPNRDSMPSVPSIPDRLAVLRWFIGTIPPELQDWLARMIRAHQWIPR